MDKNKLILAISILLGCIILGGFYYSVEKSKQELVERQENKKQQSLKECLDNVQKDYMALAKLNGFEITDDKFVKGPTATYDKMKESKKAKDDDCFRQFK
ncbi:MAG: hypothetical protein NTY12_05460 [Candidatus Falkowbacteria bacterium]|nr:hypothetical protein [Candidatus Falkowbacteria bacterium]